MSDEQQQEQDTEKKSGDQQQQQQQGQTFSQADVDRIVRERLARQAKDKYGDYDELKTKAAGTQTLEERLAGVEKRAVDAEARALRSDIAAQHGISAEDRDLFLTGTDEASLTAQAERLAARETERKKNGNTASNEGGTKQTGTKSSSDKREFARALFGSSDD